MGITAQQSEAELTELAKSIPTYSAETFTSSVKKGDKYKFSSGRETYALCDSYLNCDNMEGCQWAAFGFWLVCHMEKI